MKKLMILLLTVTLALALAIAGMARAEEPARPFTGATEYDFVGLAGIFDGEGRLLTWEGTITGDIEGVIQWWMVWPPSATGQVTHFVERFEIWDSDDVDATLLLAVEEEGTTTIRPGKTALWRANGIVTDASPEFEDWIGRTTHNSGDATWAIPGVLPLEGKGTFRVH